MNMRWNIVLPFCATFVLLSLVSQAAEANIRATIAQATRGFKDITLTGKVLQANQNELQKIGKDFPKSYEFKTTTIRYKAPDKMRMEGKLGMVSVAIVINGNQKAISVPSMRVSKKEDIKASPHKRQTDIDIGIVTESLWRDYIVTNAVEEKSPNGPVYKITYVRSNARDKKHVVWVDAKTLKLLKMEKYEDDGSLKSRFLYSRHTHAGGIIWVPGRIEVYNQEGKLAGVTSYENIKVNTGIADSVFKI